MLCICQDGIRLHTVIEIEAAHALVHPARMGVQPDEAQLQCRRVAMYLSVFLDVADKPAILSSSRDLPPEMISGSIKFDVVLVAVPLHRC